MYLKSLSANPVGLVLFLLQPARTHKHTVFRRDQQQKICSKILGLAGHVHMEIIVWMAHELLRGWKFSDRAARKYPGKGNQT